MDRLPDGRESKPCGHGERQLADHLACMAGDDGRAEYLVAAFPEMDPRKTFRFPVQKGPVGVRKRNGQGQHVYTPVAGIFLVHSRMRHFRVRIRAPGDHE